MKNILVFGAGLVVQPLVDYLLDLGWGVTVASRTLSKAEALTGGRPNTRAMKCDVTVDPIDALVAEHDLAVSLLPAPMHPTVAKACIAQGKPLVTTSYVSEAMKELDGPAKEAGVVLLNELGLDPGIDHMSAMAIIHEAATKGGKVTSFQSYCGGLPAPDSDDNPFGYKFSWSPRGVLTAARNDARYLDGGEVVEVPGPTLFAHYKPIEVGEAGTFEGYPNRDSVAYQGIYGLQHATKVLRGTLRNVGHCDSWKKIVDFGMLDLEERDDLEGLTRAQFTATFLDEVQDDVKTATAAQMGVGTDDPVIAKLRWLGMFDDEPLPTTSGSALDVLAAQMWDRMQYGAGQRDMILLQHTFDIAYADYDERVVSQLIGYGIPNGSSAMSRTVALPAAIGVRMILQGEITEPGVCAPVTPAMYGPILRELGELGVKFEETVTRI